MNQQRFKSILSGMTSIAQRVFQAVPIAEAWASRQIYAEMTRTGPAADYKTVEGCLRTLVNAGLVTEPNPGTFRQVKVKAKDESSESAAAIPSASCPIDRLGILASRVRAVRAELNSLADDIELVAIEVSDQAARDKEDMEKLRQLQSLLKSLN